MRGVKPFDQLTDDQLFIFLSYLYPRVYKKDEAVFFRKDPSQALYIVESGEVSLSLDRDGKMEALMTAGRAEAFGDNCFIKDTHRIYNAIVSSEEAHLFVLPQGNILEVFESKPKVKALILESLLTRYNGYTSDIFDAYKSSFGFFDLKQAYSHKSEDSL